MSTAAVKRNLGKPLTPRLQWVIFRSLTKALETPLKEKLDERLLGRLTGRLQKKVYLGLYRSPSVGSI